MLTRKDYKVMAEALTYITDYAERRAAALYLVRRFEEDNPRFDEDKFYRAANLPGLARN